MTPILSGLRIGSLALEPHSNPAYTTRRVAYYDPYAVTELNLSAIPTASAQGEFEFQVWTVPSDEPYGAFVQNNGTFSLSSYYGTYSFNGHLLEEGQHYVIEVLYYAPTDGEGEIEEAEGTSIFTVDLYPRDDADLPTKLTGVASIGPGTNTTTDAYMTWTLPNGFDDNADAALYLFSKTATSSATKPAYPNDITYEAGNGEYYQCVGVIPKASWNDISALLEYGINGSATYANGKIIWTKSSSPTANAESVFTFSKYAYLAVGS